MVKTNVAGLNMLVDCPGRAPGRDGGAGTSAARAMARWSASPRRRIRVPINQRNGDEYFVLSKR